MSTWRGGRRRVLAIASIATAVAVIVIGGVAAAVTLNNQNHGTARLTGSHGTLFTAAASVTPPVAASKCARPTAFTFSGTLSATAPGTVTYRWVYSSGRPEPVQTVRFIKAGSKGVTGETIKSEKASGGWGEITVISPVAQSSKKASYKLLCGSGGVGGITATATVTPVARTASCVTAPPGFTVTGSVKASRAERVTYYWAQSDGVNSARASLTFTKPGTQATEPLRITPPAASGSGTAVLVVTSPVTTASSPATYTLTCATPTTRPTANQPAPPTTTSQPVPSTPTPPPPSMSIVVNAPTTTSLNQPYSGTLTVTGGDGRYTWSPNTGGLAAGLTATAHGATLTISGTPTVLGLWTFTGKASDGESPAQTAGWVLDINVINPPITLAGNPPTPATVGQPYFGTLTATGGDGTPFTWSVTGLPHGLAATANGGTLTISGTPTEADIVSTHVPPEPGTFQVNVTVYNSDTNFGYGRTLYIVVSPASLASCQKEVAMIAPVPGLEPAFEVDARLGPLEDHGVTRAGHRRVVAVAGGRVSGLFDAEILPGGADWQIVRPDGAVEIDTRYSARTAAGEYVHFRTSGVRSGPPDGPGGAPARGARGPVGVLLPRRGAPGDVRAAAGHPPAVSLRGVGDPRGERRAVHRLPGHLIPALMHQSGMKCQVKAVMCRTDKCRRWA